MLRGLRDYGFADSRVNLCLFDRHDANHDDQSEQQGAFNSCWAIFLFQEMDDGSRETSQGFLLLDAGVSKVERIRFRRKALQKA